MKTLLLASLALIAAAVPSRTQAQPLEPGHTYRFEFTSVPFLTRTTTPILDNTASILFSMVPDHPFDNEFRVELFEDNLAESPFCRLEVDSSWDPFDINCLVPNVWQDLQGVVRVSMRTGTAPLSFDSNLQIFVPSGTGDFLRYEQNQISFASVPEPGTLALLGVAVLAAWCHSKKRVRRLLLMVPRC